MVQHVPFKVIFHVATPIILPFSTTLDGLLAASASTLTGHTEGDALFNEIPLAYDQQSGVFHGSTLFFGGRPRYVQVTKSRALKTDDDLDARHIAPKRKKNGELTKTPYPKMEKSKGDYAHKLSFYSAVQVPTVVGYGLGNIEQVDHYLSLIQGLGRHAQQGCGEIRHIDIEPIDDDLSWLSEQGHPHRPLPNALWERLASGGDYLPGMVAVRPPYWEEPLEPCALPLAREVA